VTWSISNSGHLDVTVTGDVENVASIPEIWPWNNYRDKIKSAEVKGSGCTFTGYMFYNCKNLTSITLNEFDTSDVKNMFCMFDRCESLESLDLSNFDTSKTKDMACMFIECKSLTTLDISSFDTSKVENMHDMFSWCESLTTLDISSFDTSKVEDMHDMFSHCESLTTLDLSNFDTSKVQSMYCMFRECKALASLNITNFDIRNVTTMESMFYNCESLTSIDMSKFVSYKVNSMQKMFYGCVSLTSLDLSGFHTHGAYVRAMFQDCKSLANLDISEFDMSNTGYYDSVDMLSGCDSLMILKTPRIIQSSGVLLPNYTYINKSGGLRTKILDANDVYVRWVYPVTGVKMDKSSIKIKRGSTSTLTATVYPTNASLKTVTWSSSDKNVVSVDKKGNIKGIKIGTATITVKTIDGSKTATCKVTVEPAVHVKSVKLNKSSIKINMGSSVVPVTLKATVLPADADIKSVTWSSSNPGVATVDKNGKVIGIKNGTAIITVKTVDGGKTATCKVTVNNMIIMYR
ncbi:MAG: BspA family leucine-rich repeat surface protein, partial [Lachnospiraceae bacterium]|nr:BspA family leucine-rich repeat surface protein [Lachnospiraceae bacterium]